MSFLTTIGNTAQAFFVWYAVAINKHPADDIKRVESYEPNKNTSFMQWLEEFQAVYEYSDWHHMRLSWWRSP